MRGPYQTCSSGGGEIPGCVFILFLGESVIAFFLLFTVTDDKLPLYHKWLLFDPNQTSLKVQMVFRPDLDSYKAKQLRNPWKPAYLL